MLRPIHTYGVVTPLGAAVSRAKASSLVYSENWVTSASFLGRIPGPASHTVIWEVSYLQGEGDKRERQRGTKLGRRKHWLTRQASLPLLEANKM